TRSSRVPLVLRRHPGGSGSRSSSSTLSSSSSSSAPAPAPLLSHSSSSATKSTTRWAPWSGSSSSLMTPITCISLAFKARTSQGTALAFSAKVIIIQDVSYYLFLYFLLIIQWSHFCYDSSYPSTLDTTTAIGDSVEDCTTQYSHQKKIAIVCLRSLRSLRRDS